MYTRIASGRTVVHDGSKIRGLTPTVEVVGSSHKIWSLSYEDTTSKKTSIPKFSLLSFLNPSLSYPSSSNSCSFFARPVPHRDPTSWDGRGEDTGDPFRRKEITLFGLQVDVKKKNTNSLRHSNFKKRKKESPCIVIKGRSIFRRESCKN